jgi:tetratricopeptide (TPR) repeat protein
MGEKTDVETSLAALTLQENAPQTDNLLKISTYAIIVVTILAYLTSFQGAFVFDDYYYILKPFVTHFWSSMFAPETVSRPLLGLSLAINYAISGKDPWSYHVFNLLIHISAALALFGIVRHTLLSERLREEYGKAATALALVVALVWAVHPLNTQAVTYIIQRCESMMGMFYLLTMYCAIRSFKAERKGWWYVAAIAACIGGMLSKQVMATAPLMVLIYDWMFVAGSWKEVLQKRWKLHAGLFATWIVLVATMVAAPVNPTAGFAVTVISPWDYFKSEFGVIVYYMRLALWPEPLVLDYAWPKAQTLGAIVPYALVVGILVMLTMWGLYRRKAVSFIGVWFFGILSMTCSVMPFEDLLFEHRMYLSLAGVVSLLVLGGYYWGKRLFSRLSMPQEQQVVMGRKVALGLSLIVITWLGFLTAQRNFDYKSDIGMWKDVLSKRPQNARAHNNLATILLDRGFPDEALEHLQAACHYNPNFVDAQANLGWELSKRGEIEEGKQHLLKALSISPDYELGNFLLGNVYLSQGDSANAIERFAKTLKANPNHEKAFFNTGLAQEKQGNYSEAIRIYRAFLRGRPDKIEVMSQLAFALVTNKDVNARNAGEALPLAEKAVSMSKQEQTFPLEALAAVYAELKRFPEAIEAAQKAKNLAATAGDKETIERLDARLKQYRESNG